MARLIYLMGPSGAGKDSLLAALRADADHAPSAALLQLYQRWANGGAGLIITGNVMIDGRAMTGPGGVVDLPAIVPFGAAGTYTITATYQGQTATTNLSVTPQPGSVTAITVYQVDCPPLEIQHLVPLSTQFSPSRRARVFIDAASLPASRSDRP